MERSYSYPIATPIFRAVFGAGPTTSVAAKALGAGAQAVNGSTMRGSLREAGIKEKRQAGHKCNTKDQKVVGGVKVAGSE